MGAQVSREPPPPLPGGFVLGEQVYYTGARLSQEAVETGDRLEHGKQGEVVGPATSESHKGNGVALRFPGNKGAINCYLTQARCRRRRRTAHPQLPVALAAPPPETHHTMRRVSARR